MSETVKVDKKALLNLAATIKVTAGIAAMGKFPAGMIATHPSDTLFALADKVLALVQAHE